MKIAYLTNCFGTQSHTFIRREIEALRKLSVHIDLYAIRRDQLTAPDVEDIINETRYLYPLPFSKILKSNLHFLFRNPLRYFSGFISAFTSEEFGFKRRAKMAYHYLLSTVFAKEMINDSVSHIHAHFMNVSASIAMYASHHSGIPYSITVHSAGTYKTPHILGIKQKLKNAQFLAMISNYNIEYFDPIQSCRNKSFVVRCGMDLNKFTFKDSRQITPTVKLLAVGRFVQKKGFQFLIEAAKILKEESFDFSLLIVGDGPLLPDLKALTNKLGLNSVIKFAGQQQSDYVLKAMHNADIVIVPSVTSDSGEKEGLPVVIMEAMASGVPVIASDHSGIHEIVIHKKTGLLTKEKDSSGIAQAISKLSTENSTEMIGTAYEMVNNTFNIDAVAKTRKALFENYNTGAD